MLNAHQFFKPSHWEDIIIFTEFINPSKIRNAKGHNVLDIFGRSCIKCCFDFS